MDNLSRTIPPIDSDQKIALLHTPFKGTNLFGGELAKLQKANNEHGSSLTVFPAPAVSSQTYTTKPYTGHGRSFRKGGYSYKREVAGIDIRIDPPLQPQLLNRPSLEMVRLP